MSIIEGFIKKAIRDVPDFPIPGQHFKDISPLMMDPQLCRAITEALINHAKRLRLDAIVGIESSGFLFGPLIAQRLDLPFILIKKQGKLPGETLAVSYQSRIKRKTLELQVGYVKENQKILIHDDTLATGNSVEAASELVNRSGGKIVGYSFLMQLREMKGRKLIKKYSSNILALASF